MLNIAYAILLAIDMRTAQKDMRLKHLKAKRH
jgi:hypothetical protein